MMLDHVSFEHQSDDRLTATQWSFFLLREKLVVDYYAEVCRDSPRKKFRVTRCWKRLDQRDCTMSKSDVPLTELIAKEARLRFIQQLESVLTVGFQ